jgi:hypothetical protein
MYQSFGLRFTQSPCRIMSLALHQLSTVHEHPCQGLHHSHGLKMIFVCMRCANMAHDDTRHDGAWKRRRSSYCESSGWNKVIRQSASSSKAIVLNKYNTSWFGPAEATAAHLWRSCREAARLHPGRVIEVEHRNIAKHNVRG